jgi:hypothetical protein
LSLSVYVDEPDSSTSFDGQKIRGMAYTITGHLATRKTAAGLFIKDLKVTRHQFCPFNRHLSRDVAAIRRVSGPGV